ncbi:hypothetical protein ACCO45_004748 [Purpureocillium lilacinum]|uniref:Uncharacterized protein n=1 Tax=Purpureocillium lilacinum TaxID=33203 RepID=A0ACC4DTN6_PURLI
MLATEASLSVSGSDGDALEAGLYEYKMIDLTPWVMACQMLLFSLSGAVRAGVAPVFGTVKARVAHFTSNAPSGFTDGDGQEPSAVLERSMSASEPSSHFTLRCWHSTHDNTRCPFGNGG